MSTRNYERIMVVTDGRDSTAATLDTGLNLAKKHNAEIMLVDTLRKPNSAARWFSDGAQQAFEAILAERQASLEQTAEQFRKDGVAAESHVLFGKSSKAIIHEAIRWNASLVVRYMKGAYSKYHGLFGNTARALIQFCPTPLLLVGTKAIIDPNVLACMDTDHEKNENNSIIEEAICLAREPAKLSGLFCWQMYGRDLIERRMSQESFLEAWNHTRAMFQKSLDEFIENNDVSMLGGGIQMENGEPSVVIPNVCNRDKIDVVVMCSATLNHPLRKFFGSTVEAVIEKLPCSLLLVKPKGFASPIADTGVAATGSIE